MLRLRKLEMDLRLILHVVHLRVKNNAWKEETVPRKPYCKG
jgi:hypothetical protein